MIGHLLDVPSYYNTIADVKYLVGARLFNLRETD
jgi:hypothetical protein